MGRSARLVDPDISMRDALMDRMLSSLFALWRNPAIVGATVASAVAFSFVSANALWNQPHAHRNAIFATRMPADAARPGETVIRIERKPADVDPVVQHVQGVLGDMGLYAGAADGVAGPRTKAAIAQYRKIVGLPASDGIDQTLITRIGGLPDGVRPKPRQVEAKPVPMEAEPLTVEELIRGAPVAEPDEPVRTASIEPVLPAPAAQAADPAIMKLQAGLRAFGNNGIEVDGVVGERTRAAIREFQSLFGLPPTGEPDAALYAKMRDVGLTN